MSGADGDGIVHDGVLASSSVATADVESIASPEPAAAFAFAAALAAEPAAAAARVVADAGREARARRLRGRV